MRRPATRKRRKRRNRAKAGPGPARRLAKWAAIVVLVSLALSVMLVLPLRWVAPPTTAFMLQDSSGREPVLYDWTPWDAIGEAMPLAVVAAEDQRFAAHFGLDLAAIRDSLEDAERGRRLRGASTITQQLIKNLYLSPSRSAWRKGIEAYLTIVAEICLPKRRILELYVNVVELGPGIYGVAAASEHFFGKRPSALTDTEAALFAAVLPNPVRLRVDAPSAYVRERQVWIVRQVQRLRRESWLMRL